MKIGNSLDWDVDRIVGVKVGRGNNGVEYIDVGAEVLSGAGEVVG